MDIYSDYIQTGFRSFTKGSGEFNQVNASTGSINYAYGSWGDLLFANTFVLVSKDYNFFSTNSTIQQNYILSEKILIKDRQLITISSNADLYLKAVSSNLKLLGGVSKYNFKNIVNSHLREITASSFNYGTELRSSFKGIFNYHLGTKWNYSKIVSTTKNSYTDNITFLDLSFVINDRLNVQFETERYYFGNLDKSSNVYYFLDFKARYVVQANKLTFSLYGNNLFNTTTFKNYSITDISSSSTDYQLQSRYLLLKMEFRF